MKIKNKLSDQSLFIFDLAAFIQVILLKFILQSKELIFFSFLFYFSTSGVVLYLRISGRCVPDASRW